MQNSDFDSDEVLSHSKKLSGTKTTGLKKSIHTDVGTNFVHHRLIEITNVRQLDLGCIKKKLASQDCFLQISSISTQLQFPGFCNFSHVNNFDLAQGSKLTGSCPFSGDVAVILTSISGSRRPRFDSGERTHECHPSL